jgi:glucan 1,3-beta-glucosidase
VLAHALAGLGLGAVGMAQWTYLVEWNRFALEWAASGAWSVLAGLLAWAAIDRLTDRGAPAALPSGAQAARAWLGGRPMHAGRDAALALLRLALLFGAATMTVLLVFDARYRGFPWPLYAAPAVAMLLLSVAGDGPPRGAREERRLAAGIGLGVPVVALMERAQSAQAWAWLACATALAWAGWRGGDRAAAARTAARQAAAPRRAASGAASAAAPSGRGAQAASAASSTPTADGSKQ